MLCTILAVAGLVIPRVALAATYTVTLSSSTASSVVCRTYSSTVSPKSIATHYTSKQLPPDFFIFSSTSTPYKTITPKPSTSTSTSIIISTTTTTPSTSVRTFTTTESFSTVSTSVTTITSTKIDTETNFATSTSTSVIPAPSGFIDVDDSTGLTNGSEDAQRLLRARNSFGRFSRRNLGHESPPLIIHDQRLGKVLAVGPKYEYSVVCVTSFQPTITLEVVKVHSTVKKTVAPSTTIITSGSTSTVTVTTVPTAFTTVTVSTTSTSTETSFFTSTSTTTTTMTGTITTSSYAACSAANLLGPEFSNGQYLSTFGLGGSGQKYYTTDGISGKDCCQQCFETTGCLASLFLGDAGVCEFATSPDGSCPANQQDAVPMSSGPSNYYNAIVANGPCGQVYFNTGVD